MRWGHDLVALGPVGVGVENVTTELTVPWDLVWGRTTTFGAWRKPGASRIHPDEGTVEGFITSPACTSRLTTAARTP